MGASREGAKRIVLYLLLVLAFWAFTFLTLNFWLKPYAAAYERTGAITIGYLAYAAIGLAFSTPAPFWSVLILAVFREKIGPKVFFGRLLYTGEKLKTVLLTGAFCLAALVFALIRGEPNGSAWYMMPIGFLVMIPFVGIAEEAGWRGYLQPELEKRMKFPFSVLVVAAVWAVWHADQWFDASSNHYGDSFIGFCIHIFVWAFALAALYKATKSVMACAVYHAFVNSIGAVYDWNALFDAFPGDIFTNIYRAVLLICAIALWIYSDRSDRKTGKGRAEL